VLYTPRGYLHKVTALDGEESLSLNLSFQELSWAEVLLAGLRKRLVEDASFRENPALFSGHEAQTSLVAELPNKLSQLAALVSELEPSALAGALTEKRALKRMLDALAVNTGPKQTWAESPDRV
jgi:hypothetical protein